MFYGIARLEYDEGGRGTRNQDEWQGPLPRSDAGRRSMAVASACHADGSGGARWVARNRPGNDPKHPPSTGFCTQALIPHSPSLDLNPQPCGLCLRDS